MDNTCDSKRLEYYCDVCGNYDTTSHSGLHHRS